MSRPPCPGTRQPVNGRRRPRTKTLGGYAGRYGWGWCSTCGKQVVCHKDGSAVFHTARDTGAHWIDVLSCRKTCGTSEVDGCDPNRCGCACHVR